MTENRIDVPGRMSMEEKIALLNGKTFWETMDFPEYGISSLFLADGPCGLRKQEENTDHLGFFKSIPATAVVSGGCLAATWNVECARENGRILGEEAKRAKVDVLLAPALNIVRSPLCGRNFEYFSEDPMLTGKIAVGYVQGVQESGVGACLKHYAANNQETEREFINAVIDERTLREIYLPAFEMAVKEAKPQAVMSALNQINGKYGAENRKLLTEILREEWGFDGFTVSDWFGVVHPEKAVAAGLNLNMPSNSGVGAGKIKEALEKGTLTEEDIDNCCRHMLDGISRCMERQKMPCENSEDILLRHHFKARSIAEEGIVLLKNEDGILPLSPKEKIGVIGELAKSPKYTLAGSAKVIPDYVDIPLEEIRALAQMDVPYAQGYIESGREDESMTYEALKVVAECEKIIYFMGQPDGVEMEGHDRENLDLPRNQENLLQKILEVNPNVVVVLNNASPVAMPWLSDVKGVFECFLAGQGMGHAVARLLYGEVNPSGKLPVSFTERVEDTSAYLGFPGNAKQVIYSEGVFVGYRYYDLKRTKLLFPFGYGLSYTTFEYLDITASKQIFKASDSVLAVCVRVKNTGARAGAEIVQLYVGMFDDVVRRPVKELKAFEKVFLEPGEERMVELTLTKRDFAFYHEMYHEWYIPEGVYQIHVGASADDIRLSMDIRVEPERKHLKPLTGWSKVEELRRTEEGERVFGKMKEIVAGSIPKDFPFVKADDLENDETVNQFDLRTFNTLTNGLFDNDQLLAMLEEVNRTR